MELMDMILKEEFPPPPPHYTEDMIDLCHFILRKQPAERPTVRQVFQVDYIKTGLRQLADTVKRNTLISAQLKDCITSHVHDVLSEADRERSGKQAVSKGELLVSVGGKPDDDEFGWQEAQVEIGEGLQVFTKQAEYNLAAEDITNACPIGLQESKHANTFGVFSNHTPQVIWFRCQTQEETGDWLDAILTMVGM